MIHNTARIGRFTSSEIFKLMKEGKVKGSFGQPALTYIEEVRLERHLGRSIETEIQAKPLTWGKLLEPYVFNLAELGLSYSLCSDITIQHPDLACYAGSPDAIKGDPEVDTVVDFKAPMTLKSFAQLVDPLRRFSGMDAMNKIRDTHQDGDKFYWQLVSNAILTKAKYAELIVFCPYKDELDAIRTLADNAPIELKNRYYWIYKSTDDELPWLPRTGCDYKSLNIIRFEVPKSDKEALMDRIIRADREYLSIAA